jgi:hypothetical protein
MKFKDLVWHRPPGAHGMRSQTLVDPRTERRWFVWDNRDLGGFDLLAVGPQGDDYNDVTKLEIAALIAPLEDVTT